MPRSVLILMVLALAGVDLFLAGHHLATRWGIQLAGRPADELDWLRLEFRLSEADLAQVRRLHEGYLPRCRDFCARIAARQEELQGLLAAGTNAASAIEQKLVEIGTLRAQCQAAMLQHFQEVSRVMPPEQGQRYLAKMQRLTLGFHEEFERSMAPAESRAHGLR